MISAQYKEAPALGGCFLSIQRLISLCTFIFRRISRKFCVRDQIRFLIPSQILLATDGLFME